MQISNIWKIAIPIYNLINIYTFTKFGEILSICPQDIAQKQNSVANQEP